MKRKPWALNEYRKNRKVYIKGKKCIWCGSTEELVLHHPYPPNSLSDKEYRSLIGVQIVCSSCHYALHRYFRKYGKFWEPIVREVSEGESKKLSC